MVASRTLLSRRLSDAKNALPRVNGRRVTNADVARATKIAKGSVDNHFAGTREPNASELKLYAEYLQTTTDWLLGRDESVRAVTEEIVTDTLRAWFNGDEVERRPTPAELDLVAEPMARIARIERLLGPYLNAEDDPGGPASSDAQALARGLGKRWPLRRRRQAS